jgi:RsiW-degrading membrane proteinase PrsW (M82 family)
MKWFYFTEGREVGPFTETTLQELAASGVINEETPVRAEDGSEWIHLNQIPKIESSESLPEPPANDQNTLHPSGAPTAAQIPQKGFELPQSIKSIASNKQASAVLSDLRSMDFKAEIAPIDSNILSLIKKDFVFWAVSLLAIVPLVLVTLNDTQSQLTGFLLFFAAIWGVIFKKFIVDENSSWLLPIAALFFTGIIGIRGLLFVHEYLPDFYMELPQSENIFVAFIGSIFQTGICEELCKIIPVIIYICWKRRAAQPLTIVLIGVFSGLGFAAFENMHYANRAVQHSANLTYNHGAAGLREGVTGAMVNVLLRSMSLVFVHAIYSGIFSYFIALGHITQKRRVALALVGLLVAATVHGLYNSFWQVQTTLPAIVTATAFMLFYSYLTKLRLVMASREMG